MADADLVFAMAPSSLFVVFLGNQMGFKLGQNAQLNGLVCSVNVDAVWTTCSSDLADK